MNPRVLRAMVRKDLRLFLLDRRAVAIGIVTPIVLGTFFGLLLRRANRSEPPRPLVVDVVDLDHGSVSAALAQGPAADGLEGRAVADDAADRDLRAGKVAAVLRIPAGFSDAFVQAVRTAGPAPAVELRVSDAESRNASHVRSVLEGRAAQAALRQIASGPARPLVVDVRAVPRDAVEYDALAHAFAGFGVQFVLFFAVDLGIGLLQERQGGLWLRLRSAPLSRATVLGGRVLSGAVLASLILSCTLAFALLVMGVRVHGSAVGLIGLVLATGLMASCFGLLIASLGRTAQASRGMAILAVLVLVMLGGAWVPTVAFPHWVQQLVLADPVRWAVNGFDGVLWRAPYAPAPGAAVAALLGFAGLFAILALRLFRWEN